MVYSVCICWWDISVCESEGLEMWERIKNKWYGEWDNYTYAKWHTILLALAIPFAIVSYYALYSSHLMLFVVIAPITLILMTSYLSLHIIDRRNLKRKKEGVS